MKEMLLYFLKSFGALLTIMGPFSLVPSFLTLTSNNSKKEKSRIINKSIIVSFFLCLLFVLVGSGFFKLFGITINSFKAAGGLLLLLTAINMMQAKASKSRTTEEEMEEGISKDDVSVFPLAIPIIIGPGSVSTILILTTSASDWLHRGIIVLSAIVSLMILFLILRSSEHLYKVMGNTGLNIMTRIMGMILASLAVEYMMSGIKNLLL